jgi:hypothetical protein
MSKYNIHLNTTNWYCECCGSGTHFAIHLYEEGKRVWSTSRDDQFGGVLDPSDTDLDLHTWENFISGMTVALELAGHEVVLIENIDKTDPYDQHAWLDDDTKVEDYRDDLL